MIVMFIVEWKQEDGKVYDVRRVYLTDAESVASEQSNRRGYARIKSTSGDVLQRWANGHRAANDADADAAFLVMA
jgi:hypothetical protein